MEEIKDFYSKEESSDFPSSEILKNDSPLLDMESFETLDSSPNAAGGFGDFATDKTKTLDDFESDFPSKSASTTRPLITSSEEDISPASNLLDYVNVGPDSSLIDIGADTRVEDTFLDSESQQQRGDGDQLLIDTDQGGPFSYTLSQEDIAASHHQKDSPVPSPRCKVAESESLPKIKDPKIVPEADSADNYESGTGAYETAAQPVKSEVAMEAEKVGNATENNVECECPFSPGKYPNFVLDIRFSIIATYVDM